MSSQEIRPGANHRETPYRQRSQEEMQRYAAAVRDTLMAKQESIFLQAISVETDIGLVKKTAIGIWVPAATEQQLEEGFIRRIPQEVPSDIPILLKEVKKDSSGSNKLFREKTYYRDHPPGFGFDPPRNIRTLRELQQASQRGAYGKNDGVDNNRRAFVMWLIAHGRLSDDK